MSKQSPLNNIRIASPCSADWAGMIGTDRKRYCGECKLNVYNISGMTANEAEGLLTQSEGRLCVRYYRRADGTILTKDCPVGWAKVKERVSRVATAAFSLLMTLFAGVGIMSLFSKNERGRDSYEMGDYRPLMGAVSISNSETGTLVQGKPTTGNVAVPITRTKNSVN
ncbi:MAG: hypothetical protein ACJ72Z_14720 [Pyrinomonadaceae bacterium]